MLNLHPLLLPNISHAHLSKKCRTCCPGKFLNQLHFFLIEGWRHVFLSVISIWMREMIAVQLYMKPPPIIIFDTNTKCWKFFHISFWHDVIFLFQSPSSLKAIDQVKQMVWLWWQACPLIFSIEMQPIFPAFMSF